MLTVFLYSIILFIYFFLFQHHLGGYNNNFFKLMVEVRQLNLHNFTPGIIYYIQLKLFN